MPKNLADYQEEKAEAEPEESLEIKPEESLEIKPEESPEIKPEESPEIKESLPKEPQDNDERSYLGRRIRTVEDSITRMEEVFTKLVDTISEQKQPIEAAADDDGFEYPSTNTEFENKVLEIKQTADKREAEKQAKYTDDYIKSFAKLGRDDPDFDAIYQEMYSNFNHKLSDNPNLDAEFNFYKAKSSMLSKRAANKKENPLKGAPPKTPLDAGDNNKVPSNEKPPLKLTGMALEYAKSKGMSEESIQTALNNPLPANRAGVQRITK